MTAGLVPASAVAQQAPQPSSPPAASPAQATPAPATEDEEDASEAGDIVVTGSRTPPGSVIGDIPPDQTLSPADIRSYGVSSVNDLLTELAPQTTSGRGGAPVVLLNGKRISGFQEIRDIPTEAIQRVEILPEEVALKYGYTADSRVVNIVLRRRFRAVTGELQDRVATEGGRHLPEADLDLLRIQRDGRANLHLEYEGATALLESERNIAAATSDDPANPGFDQRRFRTLLPSSRNLSANAIYAQPLLGTSATFNARVESTDTKGLFGLLDPSSTSPLVQDRDELTVHLGSTVNGNFGQWRWSFTGNYDRDRTDTATQTSAGAADPLAVATNRARSVSTRGGGDFLLNGSLFQLPAGTASTSIRIGASTSDLDSRSERFGVVQVAGIARDVASAQANLDLPIANRTRGGLEALGSLSANLNMEVEQLSDFGTLITTGYGLNWSPIEGVRLIGSVTDEDQAPSAQQLGGATIVTPGVRVFDYVRGTTATVTTVTGGNPLLTESNRHVEKLGLTLKPWTDRDLNLTANFVRTAVDDPTATFPAAIAAIEAAFPDRFTRNGDGQLIRLDTRPVNFARTEESQLRWGINFSKPLKSRIQRELEAYRAGTGPNPFAGLRPPGGERPPEGGPPPAEGRPGGGGGPPGAGGGGRGPGGFGGGGFGGRGGGPGGGGGRLQFALYHTWHFTDRVLIARGGPSLDLLNGDAIGASGGQSRHELEGQAGYTNNGLGARLSVNYRTATEVNGLSSTDALRFGALATANLRLFADLGGRLDWVRAHPWLRGARVSVSVDNLFNRRQRVTDATGATPVSYQPDYLDPLGRTVRVSVRKLFF
ncbi:TonB-dependent receptor [Sphingomonas sp. KR1UV-12]|uniref:TonB-dependent receptor n=1 Tax=Sphingomonas aurea TaxID=3063994 RepID=A0ABT9EKF7_9SPHN|nr:TonB-dependent receptor [Sphingomonas sp. KR1UV-12]MDP1027268.1 TonB-dependent receptor [Sphingomonas sp. KR1UV-12]